MSEYEGKYGNGNLTALFGGQPFDPQEHEPSKEFEVLPPGKYTCLIESAELKTNSKGTGKLVKVVLCVIDGQFKNRKLFDNINVQNPDEECQRMGIAQLSSIGRAAQCYPVNDTADLVGKVVVAVITVKKRKDTGADANNVRMYESPSQATNAQHAPEVPGNSPYGPAPAQEQPPYANPAPAPRPAATKSLLPNTVPAAAAEAPNTAPGSAPWKQ